MNRNSLPKPITFLKLLFKFSSRQKTTTVLKQRPHVKIQDIKKTYVLNILVIEQFLLDNIKKGISDVFLQKEGYCGVQRENY